MRTLFYLALALLLVASCEDEKVADNLEEQQTGRLTLRLTDAPFPFDLVEEANVTVFKVTAKLEDESEEEEESESSKNSADDEADTEDEEENSFVLLMEEEVRVNLLELTNGVTQQLADIEVPVGTYKEIRLFVRDAEIVLTDGKTFDLKMPSGSSSGIKLKLSEGVLVDGEIPTDLLLDFDVSRSFIPQGNSMTLEGINAFNFKPVIKVSVDRESGSLFGLVTTLVDAQLVPIHGAQISVLAGDSLNTTAFSDVDGAYKVMGLSPGMYKALAEKEGFISSDTLDLTVSEQGNTELNFLLEADQE